MRLKVRNKIIELVPTIIEGINFIQNSDDDTAIKVLDDCRDAVISIFNTLDGTLSEEKIFFYADIISPIIEIINEMKDSIEDRQKVKSLMVEIEILLNNLKHKLHNESEVKLEIVFLPYKASMWDSMESIWRAAKDDPRCNCYVVPIPYYVNTENNVSSASILEYEGENFNNDVQIIHYNKYDISVEKPDIIYIHNPYDNINTLTQVPERFFSRNLKQHTNMLVYSPYYVSLAYNKVLDKNYLYKAPGVFNSDKVISQSFEISELFYKILNKDSKVLTYGSPKIDSVIYNMQKKDICIPDEWIRKTEGKKVFLLNTKIFQFNMEGQNTVKDLLDLIYSIIKDPNCVLIWRPHPLARSGIKKYYPKMYDEYLKLEESFKKMENCIYDDLPTYTQSFCLSDTLISGWSSMVANYIVTKKPIYLLGLYGENSDYKYIIDNSAFYMNIQGTSINEFRDMIIDGKDIKYEKRIKILQNTFPNLEGNAGVKIHKHLCDNLINSI